MNLIMEGVAFHKPVLVDEVLNFLDLKKFAHSNIKGKFIDATLGLGGYEMSLQGFNLKILGIDADSKSLSLAKERLVLAGFKDIIFERANFKDIVKIAQECGFTGADAILFDLGVSSYQFENPEYGLSFRHPNAVLDMRIDKENNAVCAKDILNFFDVNSLKKVFELTLSKRHSRLLAAEVVRRRQVESFRLVDDLLKVVERVVNKKYKKLHPATLAFLALRMVVNSELENLKEGISGAFELLKKGGRLGVISFHSGEDRVVKGFFYGLARNNFGEILTKKPIVPLPSEVLKNPRSRSAKLRVIQKL